jgi:hypothetical protein
VTPDGYVFKLKYKDGLMYLPMEYPNDDDLASLPRVYMTSEVPWNPDEEADDDDDVWFDASDSEDLEDEEFYDSRDQYFNPGEPLYVDTIERTITNIHRDSKPKPNRVVKKRYDVDKLRPYLAWKSPEIVKATIAATTQFAKNVFRIPMRKHYKSRWPALRVPRLNEVYATDTFFANETAMDGITMAQLYCGRDSYLMDVFGMKEETQMPGTLFDFIHKWGAMDGLYSDNAKVQTSYAVQDILRQYNINDMQSEPEMQHQNPAERRIQEVKSMTNILMDRSGSPKYLWFLCMLYVIMILNCLAHPNLDMRTPIEVALGYTPDISALLCFVWYQPIFYYRMEGKTPFPESKEKLGRFVGISESKGDALTFKILTNDTKEVIHRSVVRPADDPKHPNARLFPDGGESDKIAIKHPILESEADCVDPSRLKLPDVSPENLVGMTFLRDREVDGSIYHAEVMKCLEKDDADYE